MKFINIFTQNKNSQQNAALFFECFLSTWAITKLGNIHPMNIFAFFLFVINYSFIRYYKTEYSLSLSEEKRRYAVISCILSVLFSFFYISDQHHTLVKDLDHKLFQFLILTITSLGLFFLFYRCICYILYKFNTLKLPVKCEKEKIISRLPFFCFFLCILCRIPWFLYSYPGICTPDSINQFEQVLGMIPYSNHHPWLHTLTISLFYHIGTLFTSDINNAFAFYTMFQICFMAFSSAYFIWILTKYLKSVKLILGLILLYALLPYHNVMAVSIWKDVLFSGSLLLFTTSLFHLLKEGIRKQTLSSAIIYFISGFFMCLYRSNGWYAFMACVPFLLFVFYKNRKIMYPLHFLLIFLVIFIKGPVMNHYHVTQPDFIESISIPLQQIGRVIATGQELTQEEADLIDEVIDRSYVPQLYTEYISDNMKELVRAKNPQVLTGNKMKYLKLWLTLGLKYPDIYFDAYIAQTNGYFSPAVTYSVAEPDGIIDNDTGLYREYLIGNKLIVKLREISLKLQNILPLYGSLWSMGSLLWLSLLFLGMAISRKQSLVPALQLIILWLPNLAVIGTLFIATPVATDFRYAYNLAYCIPLYFSLLFIE